MWSGQCKLHQRREHRAGLPPSLSPNTDLPSTKVNSKVPFAYDSYSWQPSHLPSHCIYGQNFNVEHALICTRGGIPFNLPQWAEGHDGWAPHWSVSQCRNWTTTSTTHRWTSYTRITRGKQGGWGRLDIAADNWERDQNHAFLKWRCSAPSQSHQNTFLSQC